MNATKQRVATSEEVEQLILQGWKFVGTLPNGKVVLERTAPHVGRPPRGVMLTVGSIPLDRQHGRSYCIDV